MYERILTWAASEIWAIDPLKARAVVAFLAYAATGNKLTTEERAEKIGAPKARAMQSTKGSVAVIPMHGILSQRGGMMADTSEPMTSADGIRFAVNQAAADPEIKSILLHVDSPGGSVYGVRELAAAVRSAREQKPVIAQVDSIAASAAYWVASQATEIAATTGADVGSIGVYTVHEDLSRALEAQGVATQLISAGKYKTEGNPFAPLSDEARAAIQGRVDEIYAAFIADVAAGRGVGKQLVEANYGQGRTLGATPALAAGMIDRISTSEETLARFAQSGQAKDYSRIARACAAKAAV